MKLLNEERPLGIAIVGMPRSGSTIIGAFFNSLENSFIVGEPHSMVNAKRPFGHDWPALILSEYGTFELYPRYDVLAQIKLYAAEHGASIYGFKEVFTINSDPPRILKHYGSRIDITFVIFREPRRNYASALAVRPDGHMPMSPITFNAQFKALADLCQPTLNTKIFPISYERFMENPPGHIHDATGWEFEGELNLKKFPGTGDAEGRNSSEIRRTNTRDPFDGRILNKSDRQYEIMLERYPYMKQATFCRQKPKR